MLFFEVVIAIATDNCKIVERHERFCHALFCYKELLAFLAPRLEVFRIGTVLNEANRIDRVDHVTANNCSDLLAVLLALEVGRLLL